MFLVREYVVRFLRRLAEKRCFLRAPWKKGRFFMTNETTKKLAGTGIFAALAFVISLLEFPIFPAAGFLQFDFSLVFILLAGFIFGPVSGITSSAVKELLRFAIGSGTGGVGEIANFIVTVAFIIIPTVVYRYKKGLPVAIITLAAGCIMQVGAAMLANRYINFPLYMGESAKDVFASLWYYVLLFNLIKAVAVSVITVLLYKRVSAFIKICFGVRGTRAKTYSSENAAEGVSENSADEIMDCPFCGASFSKPKELMMCPRCGAPLGTRAGEKRKTEKSSPNGSHSA